MAIEFISRWLDHIVGAGFFRSYFQNPGRILRYYVKPGMTVLDIGCGEGFFSLGMAGMVGSSGKAICVDINADTISQLKLKAAKAGLSERIDARICTEQSLKIDDLNGQIDFALAFYVVHHAADVPKLMSHVFQALKPGGAWMIVEPSHHSSDDYCEKTETLASQSGFRVVDHPKLIRDWAVLLKKE
jgi:ubiquinone/menaquinone biosynthesis C-methylase UbiE